VRDTKLRRFTRRRSGSKPSVTERVDKYREKLRAAGLRPVQLWLPDTRKRGFTAVCRRQSLMLHDDPQEAEVLAWLEAAGDDDGWR
jgi:hypothetical protein